MRSVTVAASALAFAVSAMAQVEGFAVMSAPAKGEKVSAGSTYTIQWDAGSYTGPVAISLLGGKTPETLQPGAQIASSIPVTANAFDWSVDCTLGADATYGIKITSVGDESLFQYSFPFHIDNSGCGEEGGNEGGHPTISVSGSGYPTFSHPVPTDCETGSSAVPEFPAVTPSSVPPPVVIPSVTPSSVVPPVVTPPVVSPPAETMMTKPYPTTVAPPPASTTPVVSTPVVSSPVVSSPVAPPATSSFETYVTSEAPAPSSTSPPAVSVVPVAAAGRNAAGSLAAFVAIAAVVAL